MADGDLAVYRLRGVSTLAKDEQDLLMNLFVVLARSGKI